MATNAWGNLPKTQVDNTKVEEQIDTDIAAHNADPNAHISAGESTQIHKGAAVIDHPAGSIIEDKIGDDEVTPAKVSTDLTYLEQVSKNDDQTLAGDRVFVDVSDLVISITSSKAGSMLIQTTIFASTSGDDANPMIRFKVTRGAVVTYYPSADGWDMLGKLVDASNNFLQQTFFYIVDLPSDTVEIKVQAARSTPDETVKILGLQDTQESLLGILTVGSAIT